MKIKKGDKIKVITGKYKNKEANIEAVFTKSNKVLVAGVNEVKKHVKARKGQKSEIVTLTKPIDASNVMIICPKCNKVVKVGYKRIDNKKRRICKKCNEVI